MTPRSLKWDATIDSVPKCGRCRGTDLQTGEPTLLESVNLLEELRKLARMIWKRDPAK